MLTIGAGVAIGGAAGAAAGAVTGGNQTANNYLKHEQWTQLAKDRAACGGNKKCEGEVDTAYAVLSAQQDAQLSKDCLAPDSQACRTGVTQAVAGNQARNQLVTSGALPENFLGGADFNRSVPLFQQKVIGQDVANFCAANASVCDTNRTVGSAQLILTGLSATALAVLAPEVIAAGGVRAFCAANAATCVGLLLAKLLSARHHARSFHLSRCSPSLCRAGLVSALGSRSIFVKRLARRRWLLYIARST